MVEELFDMVSPAGLQKVPLSQLSMRKNEGWTVWEPKRQEKNISSPEAVEGAKEFLEESIKQPVEETVDPKEETKVLPPEKKKGKKGRK